MNLEETKQKYKDELEKVRVLHYKLSGALEATELLIAESKESKKDKK